MKYRKLRIAWSVCWGIATLVMCFVWISSHRQSTIAIRYSAQSLFSAVSTNGGFFICYEPTDAWSWSGGPSWEFLERKTTSSSGSPSSLFAPPILEVRYWLVVLCTLLLSCAGIIPLLKYRFSLGTLLIVTTLIAALLGVAFAE